jgi:two-component system sensor histidine kinase KdpD
LAAQIDSRRRDPLAEEVASTPDQVMACLSSRGGNSEALLRYASRLAGRLNRNWYAVYVQTASESPTVIDSETQRVLSNTLALAEQLGATVFTYKGDDVVETILQFAKEYRVGHIVIGSPGKKLLFWHRLMGRKTIHERLIEESKDVTVVVLDTRGISEGSGRPASAPVETAEEADTASSADRDTRKSTARLPAVPAKLIILWDGPTEKDEALRQLLRACCRSDSSIVEKDAWEKLVERERQGVTFVGEDVAIPHARLPGLAAPVIAVGVSKLGIREPATDELAHIVVLLLSAAEDSNSHVKLLAGISRMVRDPQWRRRVLVAQSVSEIAQALEAWNRSA